MNEEKLLFLKKGIYLRKGCDGGVEGRDPGDLPRGLDVGGSGDGLVDVGFGGWSRGSGQDGPGSLSQLKDLC